MKDMLSKKKQQILEEYSGYINKETLEKMVNFDRIIQYNKGDLIPSNHKGFFLASGIIRGFYLDADGNDVTHMFIMENTIFGSDFITTDKPQVCSFEALEDCIAIELNNLLMLEEIKKDTGLMLVYINMLEEALKRKILREMSLITQTATERYLMLKKDYPHIENRVSQSHIASYMGITSVSLSRIRRVLKEEN